MTSRPSTAAPILAVLAVVLVTLGAYVASYFGLCLEYSEVSLTGYDETVREYRQKWQCRVFIPLARLESKMTGRVLTLVDCSNGYCPVYATDTGYTPYGGGQP
jgi:hypothetical protein